MRALQALIGVLAALSLACGFLKPEPLPVTPDPPVELVPAGADAGGPGGFNAPAAGPVKLIQDPQVTVVAPEIPAGIVLGEVAEDYEALGATGKIDACPEGTTLQEKSGTDGAQQFCALENEVRHGPWIAFWPNGKVREIGPYVKGYRHGTFTTWNSRGKLNSRYTWTNGQIGAGQVF